MGGREQQEVESTEGFLKKLLAEALQTDGKYGDPEAFVKEALKMEKKKKGGAIQMIRELSARLQEKERV